MTIRRLMAVLAGARTGTARSAVTKRMSRAATIRPSCSARVRTPRDALLHGHLLTDNRHGLVVNAQVTQATGTAERDAAADMLADAARLAKVSITVGADKNYDTAGFVATCRANRVTPHVAQNHARAGGSAIDGHTTRWAGYAISQRKRKCIEQVWLG